MARETDEIIDKIYELLKKSGATILKKPDLFRDVAKQASNNVDAKNLLTALLALVAADATFENHHALFEVIIKSTTSTEKIPAALAVFKATD